MCRERLEVLHCNLLSAPFFLFLFAIILCHVQQVQRLHMSNYKEIYHRDLAGSPATSCNVWSGVLSGAESIRILGKNNLTDVNRTRLFIFRLLQNELVKTVAIVYLCM